MDAGGTFRGGETGDASPTDGVRGSVLTALSSWTRFRALVVGDFMLDQLLYGDAERLSADAPVPVLDVRRQESRAGGAANVCLDLAALGGSVRAFGVVGEDAEAELLRGSLSEAGVEPWGLVSDAKRPTTVKRSLVGLAQARHPQKMFRVDMESRDPVPEAVRVRLLQAYEAALAGADVVCLEDYGKGVCDEILCRGVIDLARRAGVPVLVDPAAREDFTRYRGATAVTPNRTEAERATGRAPGVERGHVGSMASRLLEELHLDAVVLTLDKDGSLLLERGGAPVPVPTVAREVYDVTGAGDMMLAGLAAARSNGLGWPAAVELANTAAGLEVEQFGVVPISIERVHAELLGRRQASNGRLRSRDEIVVELAAMRSVGKRVVFTNGCFDLLHAGHAALLERARAQGDYLVVGLNTDASVRRLKGDGRPVTSQDDRAAVLGALRAVDAVVLFDEDTPERLIRAVRPDVLVKGSDYAVEDVVGAAFVESIGGRVELVELVPGKSTTALLGSIRPA